MIRVYVCQQCGDPFPSRDAATLCPHCVSSRAYAALVALAIMFGASLALLWPQLERL